MNESTYRHTQVGWLLILVELLAAALLVPSLLRAGVVGWGLFAGGLLLLAMLLFSTLTVEVTSTTLLVRYGLRLVRVRIPLEQVYQYQTERVPWYFGWGIRLTPHGVLYRVSGLEAVAVTLRNGKRYQIGTDEPEALMAALRQRVRESETLSPEETAALARPGKAFLLVAGLVLLPVLAIGTLLYLESSPPTTELVEGVFTVHSAVYRVEMPCTTITDLRLETTMPRVLWRTNGSAVGSSLRGHFDLDNLGAAMLFVDSGQSPYILIRSRDELVYVNVSAPDRTQALYQELLRCRRE